MSYPLEEQYKQYRSIIPKTLPSELVRELTKFAHSCNFRVTIKEGNIDPNGNMNINVDKFLILSNNKNVGFGSDIIIPITLKSIFLYTPGIGANAHNYYTFQRSIKEHIKKFIDMALKGEKSFLRLYYSINSIIDLYVVSPGILRISSGISIDGIPLCIELINTLLSLKQ